MRAVWTVVITLSFATPAVANDISLSLPIDCKLGETCFIQNYVDVDPSEGHRDPFCGPLSYDGHKGTDFRLISNDNIDDGVAVLAAAPGTVIGTRDGMSDIASNDPNAPDLDGKDCGNGLVLSHGNGWETQYCHLKQGSVSVQKGQRVERGEPLGKVGLSGLTEFPHIHLSLRKNGSVVDPFAPTAAPGICNTAEQTLWDEQVSYQAGGLLDAGFSGHVPEYDQIKNGMPDPDTLPSDATGLVLWGYAFGTRQGDVMEFNIAGPDGWQHHQRVEFGKDQAQLFRASGRKRPQQGWPVGSYNGTVTLERGDQVLGEQNLIVSISR